MKRQHAWLAWLAVGAVMLGWACEPAEIERAYHEDFEGELCEGTPCGWARSPGTPGQATWVETIHPGEHALRLTGDVSVRGPGSDTVLLGPQARLRVTYRCDAGSRLNVDVIFADTLGSRPLSTTADPSVDWSELDTTLGRAGEISNSRIVGIVLSKTGTSSCEIGDVLIDDVGFVDDITC